MKKLLISTLVAGTLAGSVFAQGTVSLSGGTGHLMQWNNGTTTAAIPVGSTLGAYGAINIDIAYAPVSSALPTGWNASTPTALSGQWTLSSTTPIQAVAPLAGWTALTTFNLGAGSVSQEAMVLGWTGAYADWNSAVAAAEGGANVLLGWSGSALSGGAFSWTQTTGNPAASPPVNAVGIVTGAAGFNGLVMEPVGVPEPSTFALAGLGAAALMIFRRRK